MNPKWKDMTPNQKKLMIALCVYVAIAFVFAIIDLCGVWTNNIFTYMLSAYFLVEGVVTWKKNRLLAILHLVLGIIWPLSIL